MAEKYNGLLLVNKPGGIDNQVTSHDIVDKIRKVFGTRSVGHCGTLDPMASGLMVMLIGEATKLSNYILEKDKAYRLRAQFGITTDTLDMTGQVLSKQDFDDSKEVALEKALSLQGEMNLLVPMFSAVKVGGTRLHELARKGEDVERPLKLMRFDEFRNIEQGPDWIEFDMSSSKGSYVRAWVSEFGKKLECGATLSSLIRLESKPYDLKQAYSLEEISKYTQEGGSLEKLLIPISLALPDYKTIRVDGLDMGLIVNGQVSHGLKAQLISVFRPGIDLGVKIVSKNEDKLLALIGLEADRGFVIRRVFKY
jgi:tRNA pseudouridine55 synthase